MITVYVDSDYKCHVSNDGTMQAVETDFFVGKCDAFIEGYCCDTRNGYLCIYPWRNYSELDAIQREHEKQSLAEYEALVDELYAEVTS